MYIAILPMMKEKEISRVLKSYNIVSNGNMIYKNHQRRRRRSVTSMLFGVCCLSILDRSYSWMIRPTLRTTRTCRISHPQSRATNSRNTVVPLRNTKFSADVATSEFSSLTLTNATQLWTMISEHNMTRDEINVMSATGTLFSLGLLYTLATTSDSFSAAPSAETLEVVGYNIVDAALPLTASDFVSVAVGESLAGTMGAAVSYLLCSVLLKQRQTNNFVKVSDAVADGDFLLTNAAAKELLSATGLSPLLTTLVATAVAIIPYGIVKVKARQREQQQAEAALLQELLDEEQTRRRQSNIQFGTLSNMLQYSSTPISGSVDAAALAPVLPDARRFDWVEACTDILKWLQFDVLKADFGGHVFGLDQPGLECALFGMITALTSQFYADVLYAYFGLGGVIKKETILARTTEDWTTIYISKMIYCAVLFGAYAALQDPAASIVAALGSGGVDNCVGSSQYASCIETFVRDNSPTPDAEFRSLVTAAVSFWNNHAPRLLFSLGAE
jgi:hypothetical protein